MAEVYDEILLPGNTDFLRSGETGFLRGNDKAGWYWKLSPRFGSLPEGTAETRESALLAVEAAWRGQPDPTLGGADPV